MTSTRPNFLARETRKRADVLAIHHVQLAKLRRAARGADLGHDLLQAIGAACAQNYFVAILRQHTRRCFADAAARARDQYYLRHDAFSEWVRGFAWEKVSRRGAFRGIHGPPR